MKSREKGREREREIEGKREKIQKGKETESEVERYLIDAAVGIPVP